MKIIHILVISCLFSFISIPSKAQSPVQNIEQEDRIIIKNFVDSLLLTHAIDSVAAKKAYIFINNRMNEGYYDNYADNNINYLLQITHDIQKILDDNYFEAFFASPAEKGKTQLNKNADVVRHWWNKTGYDNITYDSLHKAGKIFKIPFRPFTRGYNNKGWFSKVLFYEHIDEMLTYKTGYNGMGVPELKILEGNIGYVKIKHWIDNTQLNIPIWAVVAHYLYNTEAIIVDVRDSGEGDITAMINFLRYFLPPSKDYLGSTYQRATHTKQDFFNTKKHVLKPHKVKKKHKRNTERYINRPLVDFSELKGKNIRLLNQNIWF